MATNIGRWSAQATLDASGFTSGIQRMGNSVRGFVSGPNGLGVLTNLPAALGISSIEGVFSRLNDTLERELDLGFVNDQLGTTIEWLSTLRTVAGENSVNAEQFASGMERMNQVLGQARLGSSEAVETFARLGITVDQINRQGFEDTFMQVARALATMPDRAARARTAMELFGRGGAGNMLRFVQDLDRSMADVQARGGFTTAEDLARFQEMDNAIDRMTTRWENMWRNWLSTIAPAATAALEAMTPDANAPEGSISSASSSFLSSYFRTMLLGYTAEMMAQNAEISDSLVGSIFASIAPMQQGAGGPTGWGSLLGGIEEQFHGVIQDVIDGFRQMNEAQQEAARIIEAGRTPSERFQTEIDNYTRLLGMGQLTQDQFNRAVGQSFDRLTQGMNDVPEVGSLEQGSAEVAAIIANASNPTVDIMQQILMVQRMELETAQRHAAIAERIQAAQTAQNDLIGQGLEPPPL